MAGVVRSAGIVLLRSGEILRSIRESVAPRGVASIDPPACLSHSALPLIVRLSLLRSKSTRSFPTAPLARNPPSFDSVSFQPVASVVPDPLLCFSDQPFSVVLASTGRPRECSASLARTDSSFLPLLIRPSQSNQPVPLRPSIYARAFFLSPRISAPLFNVPLSTPPVEAFVYHRTLFPGILSRFLHLRVILRPSPTVGGVGGVGSGVGSGGDVGGGFRGGGSWRGDCGGRQGGRETAGRG